MNPTTSTLPDGVTAPPDAFNFARHLLEQNAARAAKTAFIDDQGALSYGALDERVRRLAAGLVAFGVKREERVLILMQDTTDWPVAFLGSIYAGVVPVAVNTLLTPDDYAYMLEHSRAQVVLVSGAILPVLKAALVKSDHEVQKVVVSRPIAPLDFGEVELEAWMTRHAPAARSAPTHADDPCFWLYSSGSTGRPKGTVHSQANPYWTIELYAKRVLQLQESDIAFSAAKLFFAYGLGNGLTFTMGVGATALLMAERPTPDAFFKRLRGQVGGVKPTVFFCAPTGYASLLAHPDVPRREELALRLGSSAGEALPSEIGERFRERFGADIVDGLGSTEMLHIFLSNRPGGVRYGTTGWPVPGYTIELRGEDGRPVPDGEPGDLFIQGPSSAMMYWGNREKTRETFQGGWTRSGDKYIHNADGTYTYAGRSDDMLKVSGIWVSPFEVEATLVQHPAVLEAAVIGVDGDDGLVKTKAFVVLKNGGSATETDLKAFVKTKLAPYKYPRVIEFVAELPKTATGKIQRFRLRELERAAKAVA
ncbi:MAG TPA: benzoate-CoA ligase family protein [Burkholderiaceae bacterium]|jgi:benzoate-CoA ligase|nr:benzoate-CoA ligase family protein [Burkholderiaceae bacterium]